MIILIRIGWKQNNLRYIFRKIKNIIIHHFLIHMKILSLDKPFMLNQYSPKAFIQVLCYGQILGYILKNLLQWKEISCLLIDYMPVL
jgi:hypothetical protein